MTAATDRIKLAPSWKKHLLSEFEQEYMLQLRAFLASEKNLGKVIYPAGDQIFSAFDLTSFEDTRVVIIGQDPYHGPGQAHGLCFSVKEGVAVPPSLGNIYKELHEDVGLEIPAHGCLERWGRQGVLLLNSVLTVEQAQAGAHQGRGWENFTDSVIQLLNDQKEHIVFMLWGAYAQKKGAMIDRQRHCVLKSPHPSPLSAHRGFLGNQHFSKANRYLDRFGFKPIDWSLS